MNQTPSPKQLVIVSGKGGTGKTSVTASFAQLNSRAHIPTALVDADVDASNLALLMEPFDTRTEDFYAGEKALIDQSACKRCGRCQEVCRFSAVQANGSGHKVKSLIYQIDTLSCEGCGACQVVCPYDAIQMITQQAGAWHRSQTRFGALFHAGLLPGQENSGKLVTLVKQQARLHAMENGYPQVLVDGPPGIGCPVISAFAGADLALIVTEATLSGLHDLKRILTTVRHFKLAAAVCINKTDLYPQGAEEIRQFAREENLPVVGEIPYDPIFVEAVICGMPVTNFEVSTPAIEALHKAWENTQALLEKGKNEKQ